MWGEGLDAELAHAVELGQPRIQERSPLESLKVVLKGDDPPPDPMSDGRFVSNNELRRS